MSLIGKPVSTFPGHAPAHAKADAGRRTLRTETRVPHSWKCSKLRANQQRTREATMGSWLSDREQRLVAGAGTALAAAPLPPPIVLKGEDFSPPQKRTQK